MRAIKTTSTLILAIGLLAGSAVGAVAQGPTIAGSYTIGTCTQLTATDEDGNATSTPYFSERCTGTAEFDDTRLDGQVESTVVAIQDAEGAGFTDAVAGYETTRITNTEGSWTGHADFAVYVTPDGEEVVNETEVRVLLGEGAYDGLAAVLMGDDELDNVFAGIILEQDAQ